MRALFLLLGFFVGACASAPASYPNAEHPSHAGSAEHLTDKTVALVDNAGPLRAYCSAVWVADKAILTANHCVDDVPIGGIVAFVTKDDVFAPGSYEERDAIRLRKAGLIARDADHDLALLATAYAPAHHEIAQVSPLPTRQGMFAQTMGHSLGLLWSYSSGDVSAIRRLEITRQDILWVQTTAPVSPGNSGGGLFDEDGYLIGICHGSFTKGELLNVFVHKQYIEAFLKAM